MQVSSLHWLFPHHDDLQRLKKYNFMPRQGCQFHWLNEGYSDFNDYLKLLTSKKRKQILRERRQVAESGVKISRLYGDELTDEQWHAVHRHYSSTFDRRGGYATLRREFFLELAHTMPKQLLVILAEHEGRSVASAICFCDQHTLYGRHWGCDQHFQNLHFEACYYQGLEYCIDRGLSRFDSGAQGQHKISRGFLPTPTWSAHWIADPEFKQGIEDFLHRETNEMQLYYKVLCKRSPFKCKYP